MLFNFLLNVSFIKGRPSNRGRSCIRNVIVCLANWLKYKKMGIYIKILVITDKEVPAWDDVAFLSECADYLGRSHGLDDKLMLGARRPDSTTDGLIGVEYNWPGKLE